MDLLNKGVIQLHPTDPAASRAKTCTLIISGVARSGTSMVGRVLNAAGVYLGENLDDIVFEDSAFALMLEKGSYHPDVLTALVRKRNADHAVWGFKRPHLHQHGADMIAAFRDPRMVLTVRDPVAIAKRNAIAEQFDAINGLDAAAADLVALLAFARKASCPVLLVSYEKAASMPEAFLQQLFEFCGLPLSKKKLEELLPLVEPNRPAYIGAARRVFEGYVDRIINNVLSGWAWQRGVHLPVPVTLLRDGVAVADAMADLMRDDLRASAIGDGRHGFSIDLAGKGFSASSRVGVMIGGRNFVLTNSGSTVRELGG